MGTKIILSTDDEFFAQSKCGSIWGTIYFQINDEFFPGKGWTDLAAGFLRIWLESLVQIESGSLLKDEVAFLDGPFKIGISIHNSHSANLTFIHKNAVQFSVTEEVRFLIEDAISATKQLLDACEKRHWQNTDTDVLSARLKPYR